MNDLTDVVVWSVLATLVLFGLTMIVVGARSGFSLSGSTPGAEARKTMIGDSKTVDCLCGHGDDGKHAVMDFMSLRYVGCPYAPPNAAYLVDREYAVVIDNIGATDEAR